MRKAAPEVEAIASKLRAIGISGPYASQLARSIRQPSRQMALRIFQGTGLKLGPLANVNDDDIAVLARLEGEAA